MRGLFTSKVQLCWRYPVELEPVKGIETGEPVDGQA